MRDSSDIYIRQTLKNWAAEQQPPENLRARLLLIAASGQFEKSSQKQAKQANRSRIDLVNQNQTAIDQMMQLHNSPLLWGSHLSLTPIRQVT